jgi:hypothetical protein
MKHRKLRIAWSVAWGIVAVLPVAWWVRSYWFGDFASITCSATQQIRLVSIDGVIGFVMKDRMANNPPFAVGSEASSQYGDDWTIHHIWPQNVRFCLPHWVLAIPPAALAILPWFCFHFSLRNLLFAMTLVAIWLGLVVWTR